MILKYLKKIEKKEVINFEAFNSYCSKKDISLSTLQNIFSIEHIKNKNYLLEIKNQDLFKKTFFKFYLSDENKKTEASIHGNSKTHKSPYALLTIKENYLDKNCHTIIFNDQNYNPEINIKNKLIIIENLNNFCSPNNQFEKYCNINDYNFAYGEGRQINNSYYYHFLKQYEEILCFFDIDYEGFSFYINLLKNIHKRIKFCYPNNLEYFIKNYGKKINEKEYFNLKKINQEYKNLLPTELLLKHNKKLEQEVFLSTNI